jgi:hypothetical protein
MHQKTYKRIALSTPSLDKQEYRRDGDLIISIYTRDQATVVMAHRCTADTQPIDVDVGYTVQVHPIHEGDANN